MVNLKLPIGAPRFDASPAGACSPARAPPVAPSTGATRRRRRRASRAKDVCSTRGKSQQQKQVRCRWSLLRRTKITLVPSILIGWKILNTQSEWSTFLHMIRPWIQTETIPFVDKSKHSVTFWQFGKTSLCWIHCSGYFLGIFRKICVTFYSNNWSHWW